MLRHVPHWPRPGPRHSLESFVNGWKLSSDLPLRVGQTCSLTVNLPNQESIFVTAVIVRWVRGQEYGLETLVVEEQTHSRLEHLIERLAQESGESIP